MRVCILNEFFYPDNTGGTGAVLSDLARCLQDNYGDANIEVITSQNLYRSDQALPQKEDWDGIRIHRVKTPRSNTPSFAGRLFANLAFSFAALFVLLRLGKFDTLLVGTAPPTTPLAAQIYKWLTRTPYAYITYDLEPDRAVVLKMAPANHPVMRLLTGIQSRWLRSASKVIVLGRCMRGYLMQNYGLSSEDIAVIPIGFDPDKVNPKNKETAFRKEHGISGFVALYAGNFGRYHNFDTILDAARELRDADKDITFVLVGNGAQGAHIKERVAAEALSNVRVLPFVPEADFEDMAASGDVSLVTLEPGMEGLCVPSKLYSTMAAGRATIAMVGAQSEVAHVVTESDCGIHLTQGDAPALVAILRQLARDPDAVKRMGDNARRTLEAKYATAQIAHQYYCVFAEITNGAVRAIVTNRNENAAVAASYRPADAPGAKATKI